MISKLLENWALKLLSLVFAVVLWFFVMGEQKMELQYSVPLELKNIPKGLMVANEVPSTVDVRISGPRTLLNSVRPSDISIAVDLRDLQPGLTSFKRLEERLNIPSALKVTRVSPSFVDIKLERIKDKAVPVQVVLAGEPPEGYQVVNVKTTPQRVTVTGAESEIKNVTEVLTEPVDLQGVKESFSLIAPLDYRGRYTSLKGQQTVEVQVEIKGPPPAADTTPQPEAPTSPTETKK